MRQMETQVLPRSHDDDNDNADDDDNSYSTDKESHSCTVTAGSLRMFNISH